MRFECRPWQRMGRAGNWHPALRFPTRLAHRRPRCVPAVQSREQTFAADYQLQILRSETQAGASSAHTATDPDRLAKVFPDPSRDIRTPLEVSAELLRPVKWLPIVCVLPGTGLPTAFRLACVQPHLERCR